jgi:hypothetical protein
MVLFYQTILNRRPRMARFDLALAQVREDRQRLLVPDRINGGQEWGHPEIPNNDGNQRRQQESGRNRG